jgi:hypothetical protein
MPLPDFLPNSINELASGERLRHALLRAVDEAQADTSNRKRQRLLLTLNAAVAAVSTGADATVPTITARQNLAGVNVVRITCSEGLNSRAVPAIGAFALAPARTITKVEVQGPWILLTYAGTKYVAGDNPTVAYTQPAATQVRVEDDAGNLLATSGATAVTVL